MDSLRTPLNVLALIGLAVGGICGLAGAAVPQPHVRSLLWGIDGCALVMASAILTLKFHAAGREMAAAGFLVFVMGQTLVVSGSAGAPALAIPTFGAGAGLWAIALLLIGSTRDFPFWVRALGLVAALLLGFTSLQIFSGDELLPTAFPLPSLAYPFLVATFFGWGFSILKRGPAT